MDCVPSLTDIGFSYSLDTLASGNPPGTHVIYQTGAADEPITTTYTNVFTHNFQADCPVTSCTLEATGCTGTAFVSTDISIGGTTPWAISAIRTNSVGYDHSFCIRCIVSPINEVDGATVVGLPDLPYTRDIRVIGDPLDCVPSLTDIGFSYSLDTLASGNPPGTHVIYQTGAADEPITTTYTNVFTHNFQADCPVTSCTLEATGCTGTAFVSTDISIGGTTPWAISAIRTNSVGYDHSFCIRCIVSPINEVDGATVVGLPDLPYTRDIRVIGEPLDCSPSLTDIPYT